MKKSDHKWRWVTVFFTFYLAACSAQDDNPLLPKSAVHVSDNTRVSCAPIGPLSCAVHPFHNLETEACAHLQRCLEGTQAGDLLIEQVLDCDQPVLSATSELGSAAAVATRLAVDGPPSHGAYLFVHFAEGWCPVDQLLIPAWNHGGYCETQFQLHWDRINTDSPVELLVTSERICHMPLDQEEIAAGESNVAMVECRKVRYSVSSNLLTTLWEQETEEPCQFKLVY